MESTILSSVVSIAAALWFFIDLRAERKISAGHRRKIEALTADKHALMRENDRLQARIDKIRPPFGGLLSELPELFTDEEFATRAQRAEEGRAKGRRLNDRYEGPKPGIDWEEHDETFSKG